MHHGVIKDLRSLSWGGGRNRKDPNFRLKGLFYGQCQAKFQCEWSHYSLTSVVSGRENKNYQRNEKNDDSREQLSIVAVLSVKKKLIANWQWSWQQGITNRKQRRIKKFCAVTAVLGGKIYGVFEAVNIFKDPSLTYLKAKETGVVYQKFEPLLFNLKINFGFWNLLSVCFCF